jgi:hypothetical protein
MGSERAVHDGGVRHAVRTMPLLAHIQTTVRVSTIIAAFDHGNEHPVTT